MSNESKLIEAAKDLCEWWHDVPIDSLSGKVFDDRIAKFRKLLASYQPEPVITAEHWAWAAVEISPRIGTNAKWAEEVYIRARLHAIESARKPKYSAAQYREMAKHVFSGELEAMLEQAADQLSKPV